MHSCVLCSRTYSTDHGNVNSPVRDGILKLKSNELTSPRLQQLIEANFGLKFSCSKITKEITKEITEKVRLVSQGAKYCQLVKEVNQPKRLELGQRCLNNNDDFDDVILTDESSIQMEWHGKIKFHRWWEPLRQKGVPKHPYKVHVDGCSIFVETILRKTLLPFISTHFPKGHRFQPVADTS